MLWLFDYQREYDPSLIPDLLKNPRVVLQDRYYGVFVAAVNLAVFGIGCLFTSPFASFYFGVLLRMAVIHHSTWFINSLCHTIGSKTYARELSAVDNALLALVTFGEGYHNYHHAFAADYRNGIRWYHFDPSKWTIWLASKLGMTEKLRVINDIALQKALVLKDKTMIIEHLEEEMDAVAAEFKAKLEEVSAVFEEKAAAMMLKARELKQASDDQRKIIKQELKAQRASLKVTWKEWITLTKQISKDYQLAH
ncbi:MAG: stearoyl-CoA desaturase (delta-9 desaturase) [Lentimonas sp.]